MQRASLAGDTKALNYSGDEHMLRGKKTYLSPLTLTDAAVLYNWINERPLVILSAPYSPTHHSSHLEWLAAITNRRDIAIFGIRRTLDDLLVGSCQLHSISQIHRSAELQIRIGRDEARGKGLGKDACELLLKHAFSDLNLNRVHLHVLASNVIAINLYLSIGFREEGRLRESVYIDGGWQDVLMMGILRREYDAP
jgi:RimJ/RimL family protein N-acetyltransferase